MDIVSVAENVVRHFRIPAVGLMTKMYASLKQLTHRIIGKRHFILRFVLRGVWRIATGIAVKLSSPRVRCRPYKHAGGIVQCAISRAGNYPESGI
jgi:hypothetical protein